MTLSEALSKAERLERAFIDTCKANGFAAEWAAYRSVDGLCGEPKAPWPDAVDGAHKAYISALHAYYLLRDGPLGVLGGRGL